MDEIIVRVLRSIACLPRLRVLSRLAETKEMTPSALAAKLGMNADVVSAHLQRLASDGLLLRRRSGVWCYCTAKSPYSDKAFSGKLTTWLVGLLRDPQAAVEHSIPGQVCTSSREDAETALHELIVEAVTAFTHLRRLQILWRLLEGDAVSPQSLCEELHMSEPAVSRHTGKLLRRGYLERSRQGRLVRYRLSPECKTPLHAELLSIICSTRDRG